VTFIVVVTYPPALPPAPPILLAVPSPPPPPPPPQTCTVIVVTPHGIVKFPEPLAIVVDVVWPTKLRIIKLKIKSSMFLIV
jgi:hypothetical protein